jgi:hypothetical protein
VERLFPETRVAKFSAFARILRCGSEALRALVCASTASTDGTNDTFDLAWATENITEKRLAQMSRVLRNTRIRAIAAEAEREKADRNLRDVYERLAVLTARVAPSPVYHEIVEFEVSIQQKNDPHTGQVVFGPPLHSFTVMMDKAVTFVKNYWYPQSFGLMRMGHCMGPLPTIEMELFNWQCRMQNVTQVIAPTVRPVYGDVIAVPAHFNHFQTNGAGGTNTKLSSTRVSMWVKSTPSKSARSTKSKSRR